MKLKRISKREAKQRFANNQPIRLCPCKMRAGGPFSMDCLIFGKEYLEKAQYYHDNTILWKGTVAETAWHLMYNNWAFYNATYETGYYAHYYIEVEQSI